MIKSEFLAECKKWQSITRTSDEEVREFDALGEDLSNVAIEIFVDDRVISEGLLSDIDGCAYFCAVTGLKKRILVSECLEKLKMLSASSEYFNVSTMAPLVVYSFENGLIPTID